MESERASERTSHPRCFETALRPTSCRAAQICRRCRRCSGIPLSRLPMRMSAAWMGELGQGQRAAGKKKAGTLQTIRRLSRGAAGSDRALFRAVGRVLTAFFVESPGGDSQRKDKEWGSSNWYRSISPQENSRQSNSISLRKPRSQQNAC